MLFDNSGPGGNQRTPQLRETTTVAADRGEAEVADRACNTVGLVKSSFWERDDHE